MLRFYGQEVQTAGKYWVVFIHRPVYGLCVALNEKLLDAAIKFKATLVVQCPGGEEIIEPKEWKKQGQRFEKVFMLPDRPMVFYQKNIFSVEKHSPIEKFQFSGQGG